MTLIGSGLTSVLSTTSTGVQMNQHSPLLLQSTVLSWTLMEVGLPMTPVKFILVIFVKNPNNNFNYLLKIKFNNKFISSKFTVFIFYQLLDDRGHMRIKIRSFLSGFRHSFVYLGSFRKTFHIPPANLKTRFENCLEVENLHDHLSWSSSPWHTQTQGSCLELFVLLPW